MSETGPRDGILKTFSKIKLNCLYIGVFKFGTKVSELKKKKALCRLLNEGCESCSAATPVGHGDQHVKMYINVQSAPLTCGW